MRDFFSLERWLPGLATLLQYQRAWLIPDVRAGLSVAAVALPVAIAYAELAGVGPLVGLYSCILPMLVYALFGTSRQLIVGPDAATCAVIAAVVTPLAAGDATRHWQLVMTMTAMTGLWCLIASRFKLGVLADFLSRPILMGLLNGVAITIIVGQFSKIFGFTFSDRNLIEQIAGGASYITQTHLPTMAMSLTTLLTLLLAKRYKPAWPSSMVAMVVTAALVWGLNLGQFGIATLGAIGSGMPIFQLPDFPPGLMRELVLPALNLAMVSFVSMMLTARSFAAKNGYEIDADKEFRALGLANLAAAASQGFAISGAGSRTAVNDANGGKSQLVSIIAAAAIALVTFYLTAPLQYIPTAALGVVLVMASLSLTDFRGLWALRYSDRAAFWLALISFVSVLAMGVIPGITLAVLLGLFQFLRNVMRPTDQLLGMDDKGVVRTLRDNEQVKAIPGILVYRFNSPLTYFNAPYFKRRVLALLVQDPHNPKCLVVDAVASFTHQDISVMSMIGELHKDLKRRGIKMVMAGRHGQMSQWLKQAGIRVGDEGVILCPDIYQALRMTRCYREPVFKDDAVVESTTDAILSHWPQDDALPDSARLTLPSEQEAGATPA
ncbi:MULTISPECIES: SulP family inorganic anion transporter [Aeromonas]|uniref:SulP family inorganic anion transporter n=1 Tax=Aeromonas popoffii TaxID=70856 RepID=A0ABS5GKM7_9GAMM|nr:MULTISPECIES: SulP family inorganic anion transporter [Aeromonas]MBR7627678.1 SulP family inorganic anion transporter [Aeromonas popoffii]MDF2415550.1 STAS domain-containing protein [Aeromonas sp. 1HA1]